MANKSKQKGRRGENEFIKLLEENGYSGAYRGQVSKFTSGKTAGDVECPELKEFHFEVKNQERLNIWAALKQAEEDAGARGKTPLVIFKRNRSGWKVAMDADLFFSLIRED